MRHKKKRAIQLSPGPQKRSLVIRNLITSLVTHGSIKTTSKKARVLESYADSFFAKLVGCYDRYDEKSADREVGRKVKDMIMEENAGKKLVKELVPAWKDGSKRFGFVQRLSLGRRAGDNAEKVLVTIV